MAGLIPQNFIDDLLTRIDIVDIIDGYVSLKKAGKNHQALCPFHEEKTPSFTVSQQKQFYHCFGCGANGTVISFLMDHAGMDFIETIEYLASRAGMEVPRDETDTTSSHGLTELYELMEMVVKYYCRQLREHLQASRVIDYLKSRGITGEIAAEYELGFAPPGWENLLEQLGNSDKAKHRLSRIGMILRRDNNGYYDRFRDRVMFPIRDQRGRAIGFGGRSIGEGTPKYLNSPETPLFHKGRELYGLYHAKHKVKKLERIYVVEGYMDVIGLAQFGINNVVASLGTAVTVEHMEKLFRQTGQIVFTFDGDTAGYNAAWRSLEIALPLLREGRQCYFLFLPAGEDPDSFVRKHGADAFLENSIATPLSDFLLKRLKDDLDLAKREDRAMLIEKSLTYLKKLSPSALRTLLVRDIGNLAGFPAEDLDALIRDADKSTAIKKIQVPRQKTTTGILNNTTKVTRILLQHPELAVGELLSQLDGLDSPGINYIKELMQLILDNPGINTAAILEHWRGNEKYWKRLRELASDELMFDDSEKLTRELSDIMAKIRNDYLDRKKQLIIEGMSINDLKNKEYSDLLRRPAADKPRGIKDNPS